MSELQTILFNGDTLQESNVGDSLHLSLQNGLQEELLEETEEQRLEEDRRCYMADQPDKGEVALDYLDATIDEACDYADFICDTLD